MTLPATLPAIPVVRTVPDLRDRVGRWRAASETVALVPTMGALHDGHLALIAAGKTNNHRVLASLFVNPRQFGAQEDLTRYPRDEAGDVAKLAAAGCDLVWAPDVQDIYPDGFATWVEVAGAASGLESDIRPQHFGGVATVCLKLFSASTPDVAVFGEKDYQQLSVIRQMVRDFNLPLAILAVPTVRASDGLALSSRNAYLTAAERKIAPGLYREIARVALAMRRGMSADGASREAMQALLAGGFRQVDYVAVRDADTMKPAEAYEGRPLRVLAAAWLGQTRLIDNVPA